jgi:hypothetical protein
MLTYLGTCDHVLRVSYRVYLASLCVPEYFSMLFGNIYHIKRALLISFESVSMSREPLNMSMEHINMSWKPVNMLMEHVNMSWSLVTCLESISVSIEPLYMQT